MKRPSSKLKIAAHEPMKKVWMVWYIRDGAYPALRAILLKEASALRVEEAIKVRMENGSEPKGTISIEQNFTNHVFGMIDYDISNLMLSNHRRRRELNGD